jgi:DNA repair protein RecO (recombination protein O)
MEWSDVGIVLGTRRHGEANAILEVMTPSHGRHVGLVRGGGATRLKPILQPGNTVALTWRARLEDHLGHFAAEGLDLRAASFLGSAHAVFGITHVAALCRLLPERDPHPAVYAALLAMLDEFDVPIRLAAEVARFELHLLAEQGFGLDLARCAATGATEDLVYVSPKSGRAVSREAGEPWRERLFRLPAFLTEPGSDDPTADDLAAAFALTGFFLARRMFEPRGISLPDARQSFIAAVLRGSARAVATDKV